MKGEKDGMYAQHAGTRRWQKIINHENIRNRSQNIYETTSRRLVAGNQYQIGQDYVGNQQFYKQVDTQNVNNIYGM